MAQHVIECPNCKHRLLLDVTESVGGEVRQGVSVLDHAEPLPVVDETATETPAEETTETPAEEAAEPAEVTPSA